MMECVDVQRHSTSKMFNMILGPASAQYIGHYPDVVTITKFIHRIILVLGRSCLDRFHGLPLAYVTDE